MPVKKPVTEEEAEEFLKKMKLPDYSIVEQLRKTPAQISLLSLLIHSDGHRKAIMKILNEAHVPSEITVNQLEKITGRIFEVNRITFSDDELPMEGTGHNRGLYITVKCEYSYVTRVLIDGGSGANICPLSTLQKLNVSTERIRPNNVCVRAFDGTKTDAIGEIELVLTIGPVDFAIDFQVLDITASYNLLLGRPWVHMAGAVPSTLHQVVKFEYDRQEVIVHGEGDLSIYKDSSVPFVEVDSVDQALIYKAVKIVIAEQILEGSPIPRPQLPSTSVMMVNEMLKNGFEPGKGLGVSLQGRAHPVCPRENLGTFGLGYKPTIEDIRMAKKRKREARSLTKPIPPIYKSFVNSVATEYAGLSAPKTMLGVDTEFVGHFQNLFVEDDMVEIGEGSSDADVQFIGPDAQLNNWKVTPLPTKKEFW